ncbi:putative G-protein coupled receptor [Apostichopus japonicus]|uniref:Putative G-protein coupled receptor n=1 Tax=Stichopus japonicus TaxID=307972 RepID=A0A2G8KGT2_STIJA|nr:putative G-protein coupled receptor [Apostichopus japonicus]
MVSCSLLQQKNEDGEVEVYEGSGTDGILRLPVTRSAGAIGIIGFGWTATTITATSSDFSPLTGNITMAAGQREATVDISIVDDEIEEDTERFTVHIDNPTGGAVLGEELTLLVKILKNDSPRGLFGFSYLQETVAEGGEASFSVERPRLTGVCRYPLELEAPGEVTSAQLRVFYNSKREHSEEESMSLLWEMKYWKEKKDLSSPFHQMKMLKYHQLIIKQTVIIQPDEGSSGLVSILPASRSVLVGEPTPTHDGTVMIQITRGIGFLTVDDSIPELKRDFSLILASITGGALIDSTNGANQASITVVASDSPFGIFEFQQPLQVTVDEDVQEVHMVVVRQAGIFGRVQVNYTTIAGRLLLTRIT